jgi:hypothetical protein
MTRKTHFSTARKIPQIFNPEEIGMSLREVAVDVMQLEDEHVISRWFHSNHDADLLIWTDGSHRVIKHQVSFLGQVVEWNSADGVKTGVIIEEEMSDPKAEASEIIHFDPAPQSTTIQQALRLLEHVKDLTEEDRGLLLTHLSTRTPLHTSSPKQVRLLVDGAYHGVRRPSFWKRLRKWFSGTP